MAPRIPLVTARSRAAGPVQAPAWEIHVSGSTALLASSTPRFTTAMFRGAAREEAGFLYLRRQARCRCSFSEDSTQAIVPLAPVAPTSATSSVVSKPVSDPIAEGAMALGGSNGETQTQTEKNAVKMGLNCEAQSLCRAGEEPGPSLWLLQ